MIKKQFALARPEGRGGEGERGRTKGKKEPKWMSRFCPAVLGYLYMYTVMFQHIHHVHAYCDMYMQIDVLP